MGEKVRLGIQAPRDIPVFRDEVYVEIQRERQTLSVQDSRGSVTTALGELTGA